MDPLYWRLIYADDHHEDEPLGNASIRLSHAGAVMLQACVPERREGTDFRRAVFQVRLVDAENGRLYRPVWYRKRSLTLNLHDRDTEGAGLQATVLGRVHEDGDEVEGTLFISLDGQTFGDCPQWAVDRTAVEGLLQNA